MASTIDIETFWQAAPPYREVSPSTFLDQRWQRESTVIGSRQLADLLTRHGYASLADDAMASAGTNPMAVRLTPVVLASMDWTDLSRCPVRRQFVTLRSEQLEEHPKTRFDSLEETGQRSHPRVVHRYPGRVLLLALDTCPVYCAFCTRSYMVGPATDRRDEAPEAPAGAHSLESAIEQIAADRSIVDVLISGGDVANLGAGRLEGLLELVETLPRLRRLRLGTRGFLANPLALAPGAGWYEAIARSAERVGARGVELSLQVHFNSAAELNPLSAEILERYAQLGTVRLRNQSVCMVAMPSVVSTMLAGLTSRWIRPRRWACCKAWAICKMISMASRSV